MTVAAANRMAETSHTSESSDNKVLRLVTNKWAVADSDVSGMVPNTVEAVRVEYYDHDADALMAAHVSGVLFISTPRIRSAVAYLNDDNLDGPRFYVLSSESAELLKMCNGISTVAEIASAREAAEGSQLGPILALFESSLITLSDRIHQ